jgi:hypothetical protein
MRSARLPHRGPFSRLLERRPERELKDLVLVAVALDHREAEIENYRHRPS